MHVVATAARHRSAIRINSSGSKVTHHTDRYETTAGRPGNATDLDSISWTGFNGTSNLSPTYKVNANLTDRSRYQPLP